VLREALRRMGRADLIGNGKHHLIPAWQPAGTGASAEGHRGGSAHRPFRTQHTGLPTTPGLPGKRKGGPKSRPSAKSPRG